MSQVVGYLLLLIAALHLFFLYLEMFAWTTLGPKVFRGFPRDLFKQTRTLAANQGLYNGFLAVGLIWAYFIDDPQWQQRVALCFLGFVLIAGLYGALTVHKRVFFIQGFPALVAIVMIVKL